MLIGVDASRAVVARRTGTENYSVQVIRSLVQAAPEHRFRLYLREPAPEGLLPRGPLAEHVLIGPQRLWTHLGLSWETLRRPPEVLFIPAHVVPVWHGAPTVVTVHDLGYRFYPRQHTLRSRLYLDLSTRFSCRAACRVIADSQATARDLQSQYRVPPGKTVVAYPGLDPTLSRAGKEAQQSVRARYHLERPFVLYVGTIQPRKNLTRLVEAMARLPAEFGAVELVLAGKMGWLAGGIQDRMRELGLEERVRFPGYVPQEDLAALLSAGECFVMPSLYEGFGLPVLESMACGTPVICSDAGSLPEAAGDAALLFTPTDVDGLTAALSRVLGDAALRSELVGRGYQQAARFSWERCASQVLAALLGAGSGRSH